MSVPQAAPILTITNLSKIYKSANGTLLVLANLNLRVKRGEFVSILGPSGCGKSTLFNIVAGADNPTSGALAIDGTSGTRLGKSGYMPQAPLLLPWKTVRENCMLGLLSAKQPAEESRKVVDALLEKFGLLAFADTYPSTLSGGMAQKVAVARTVLANQSFLLMDEPFGALDSLTRHAMQVWLLGIWSEIGCSVLFITHDIREAILLSDRVYVLGKAPGTVIKEMSVTLPRPRKRDHLTTKRSLALEAELEGLLLSL